MSHDYKLVHLKSLDSHKTIFTSIDARDIFDYMRKQVDTKDLQQYVITRGELTLNAIDFINRVSCSTEMVPQHFVPNAEEVTCLTTGNLENGMQIVLASWMLRKDTTRIDWFDETQVNFAKLSNRWCTVSNLEFWNQGITFTATYDDGFKVQREYKTNVKWYVKYDGVIVKKPVKPEFVSKYYVMDPETEEIVFSGEELANGMRVLIESSDKRMSTDPESLKEEWKYDSALTNNRWCTVTRLRQLPNGQYKFIGVYGDGTKRARIMDEYQSWLVKKDSLSDAETQANIQRHQKAEVQGIVMGALMAKTPLHELYSFAGTVSDRIIKVFK